MTRSAEIRTAREEWRRHWPLVAATTAAMSLAALPSFMLGTMIAPIEQEFGWTRAQITSGPALVSMMGLLFAILAGYVIDRLGARRVGIAVVLISSAGIALISAMENSLWQWWLTWGLIGLAATATSTVWVAPVSATFSRARGLALAITISGTGISSALAPPMAQYFVENHGWRTGYLAMAAIWAAVVLPLVVAFVPKIRAPEAAAPGPAETSVASAPAAGLTIAEGFRTPAFYLLFLAALFSSFAGVALIINMVPVLVDNGITRADAVLVAGSMGLASIVGRMGGGWLIDHFDVRSVAIWASLLSLAFPIGLLVMPGTVWAAYAAVILYGFTGGTKMNAVIYLTTTYLGTRSFGTFYGAISITSSIASGIAPMLASYIFDVTRSYDMVIWAIVPSFLVTALMFVMLGKPPVIAAGGE
jgi:MFS family permease